MLQNQYNEEYPHNYRELNKRVKAEIKKKIMIIKVKKYLNVEIILKRITHINYSNKFVNKKERYIDLYLL